MGLAAFACRKCGLVCRGRARVLESSGHGSSRRMPTTKSGRRPSARLGRFQVHGADELAAEADIVGLRQEIGRELGGDEVALEMALPGQALELVREELLRGD